MSVQAQRNRAGAVMMLLAIALFALMDAALKQLATHYPALQMAALRGVASLPFVLLWALPTVGVRGLLRVRWPLHLLRGVMAVAMMTTFIYALGRLPLSTVYALFFIAPLLVTALSVPILRERVGPRRWMAIVVGLIGVLVVLRPAGDGLASVAGLAVLVSALGYAVSAVVVRVLSRSDSTQAMVFWMLVLLSLGAGALAWPQWRLVQTEHLWLLAAIGLTGALGQFAITRAFALGEASVVAPLEYSALLWSLALDLALWGVLPDGITWLGAGIIIASGLYLIRREAHHAEAEHP